MSESVSQSVSQSGRDRVICREATHLKKEFTIMMMKMFKIIVYEVEA